MLALTPVLVHPGGGHRHDQCHGRWKNCTFAKRRNQWSRHRRGEWRDKGLELVCRAGDCLAPRYLADAIFDGHRIAREFLETVIQGLQS